MTVNNDLKVIILILLNIVVKNNFTENKVLNSIFNKCFENSQTII